MNIIRIHPFRALLIVVLVLAVLVAAYFLLLRLGRRTGLRDTELQQPLPGGKALSGLTLIGGRLVDWSTIELLYRCLNERVNAIQPPG